jgi:hypothetical protein
VHNYVPEMGTSARAVPTAGTHVPKGTAHLPKETPMPDTSTPALATLLTNAALKAGGQRALGEIGGASRNTVGQWCMGRSRPLDSSVVTIARWAHPKDPDLASQLLRAVGETLESVGILPARGPTPKDLADVVLCAMAEAGDMSPAALRPVLVKGLERADALGLSLPDLLGGLRAPTGAKGAAKKPRS